MSFLELNLDPREAQYARLISRALFVLREAVERRLAEGRTKADIAADLGCHPSQLSRVLNGRVKNITMRTYSDILWATHHEPKELNIDSCESLSPNGHATIYVSPKNVMTFTSNNNAVVSAENGKSL